MSKRKFIVFVVLYMLIFVNCRGKETMRLFMSHDQKNLEIADKIITYLDLKDEDGLYSLFSEQVIEEDEALKDEILALFSSYHGSVVKYEEWAIGVETKIEKGDKLSQYYSRFLVWIGETEYMLHYIYSAGCQISHLADFNEVTSILKDIGFKYGEGKDAWVKGDNIKIVIKAPPIVEN